MKAAARASTSLDQPVGETEDAVFGDFVAGDGPSPEDEVEITLRSQALTRGLAALSDREYAVKVKWSKIEAKGKLVFIRLRDGSGCSSRRCCFRSWLRSSTSSRCTGC